MERIRPAAKEMHSAIFAELDRIVEQLHQWIDLAEIPDDGTALGIVKFSLLVRAFNCLWQPRRPG
jgi:hypothetical protein